MRNDLQIENIQNSLDYKLAFCIDFTFPSHDYFPIVTMIQNLLINSTNLKVLFLLVLILPLVKIS